MSEAHTAMIQTIPPVVTNLAVVKAEWEQKKDLIKQTVARDCTDLELELFFYTAKKRGLDPLAKQIYAIHRKNKQSDGTYKMVMTIQTAIDGFRSIAGRTGELGGIEDAVFDAEDGEHPNKATVTVYRIVNGIRCPFTASARWNEYVQKNYEGKPTSFWKNMPYGQLAKCAEALALRKAFPEDLSGIYTFDEMGQASNGTPATETLPEQKFSELDERLEWIANCSTEDELKRIFVEALRDAKKANDIQAQQALVFAKDKRKKELGL